MTTKIATEIEAVLAKLGMLLSSREQMARKVLETIRSPWESTDIRVR